jgi:hypothetical protein
MADLYTFQSSTTPIEHPYLFQSRQFTFVPDSNSGNYPNGAVVFDLASLSNSGRWLDLKQSYVTIPLVLSVQGNAALTVTAENAFAASLKNGYHQLINSLSVELTNNQIVNLTSFSNLDINYKLLTKTSYEDLQNFGSSIGFQKDTTEGILYRSVADPNGLGECNNKIQQTLFTTSNGWGVNGMNFNQGRINRMLNTSYDPLATEQAKFTTAALLQQAGKNYVDRTTSTSYINYYILATIPLRILHDAFEKLPLMRGAYFRLIVNTNTSCLTTLTNNNTNYQTISTTSQNNVLPFMISPIGTGSGFSPGASATSVQVSLGIGKSYNTTTSYSHPTMSQCRIYGCLYELTPIYEELYLKTTPTKTIKYNDILSFQVLNTAAGGQFSQILTNGISRPRYLLICPFLSSVVNGSTSFTQFTAGFAVGSPMNSPFSSAPGTCGPQLAVTNFNVLVSGVNIYQSNLNYRFENWLQEIRGSNAVNGGLTQLISSGLLSQTDYENGYPFIYVNLERKASQANDDISRSIQIIGTNASSVNVDYYCIIGYEREITVSTSTGSLVI